MNIGTLARRTDTKVDTVRYYERIGLLPAPARTAGNHRVYGDEHLTRLAFVRGARRLGFTLDEVRELIALGGHAERSCDDIHAVAHHHLQEVDRKIAHLHRLRDELAHLVEQCEGGVVEHCGVLEALPQVEAADAAPATRT
ncbi:MerR family transcriptional regulator [Roseospira goensis]|uniref:Cu(I)-responsive transcriptional regulator n=1 Tax=Roseospira goensis TaxID=391922 RepID=A0A7W6S053_9PROT|nr:helix-turn-helix domain-containing protein [Roseospira goensis]MBB4286444.1 Cu(I)-responsive transcriptional regulator [Roseospira goensis]